MKKTVVIAGLALSLTTSACLGQERTTDAALGAVSGAVVLGPIGAVAGAVVGYTAGPSIAHSWHVRHARVRRQAHGAAPAATPTAQLVPTAQASAPVQARAPQTPPQTASSTPPVQTLE